MRTGKVARITDRVRKELGELTPQERDLAVKALRAALYDGFGETDDDRLLARQLGNGLYRIRRRDYQRMTPPYMEYWQKAA